MIDVFNQIYTTLHNAIKTSYPTASITGEYVPKPESFPAISIVEQDNYMSINKLDNSGRERFATLMFQIDVYSDLAKGRKEQCRSILKIIDNIMFDLNFTRIAASPMPNRDDESIYRITARYRAETDGETMYRV